MKTRRSSTLGIGTALTISLSAALGIVLPAFAQETPKGLVVFTNTPGLGAEVAIAAECTEINEFAQVVNIRTPSATSQRRLLRGQVLQILKYPNFGGTISTDAQFAALRADAERLDGMMLKYPRAKETLQVAKNRFDVAIQQIDAGKILVSGSWVPKPTPSSTSPAPTGDRIAELVVTDSLGNRKVYRDAKVVKVNEDSIQILHAAGSATVTAESLPKELRDKLKLTTSPLPKPVTPQTVAALPPAQAVEVVSKALTRPTPDMAEVSAAMSVLEASAQRVPDDVGFQKFKELAIATVKADQSVATAQTDGERVAAEHARLAQQREAAFATGTRQDRDNATKLEKEAANRVYAATRKFDQSKNEAANARLQFDRFIKDYAPRKQEAVAMTEATPTGDKGGSNPSSQPQTPVAMDVKVNPTLAPGKVSAGSNFRDLINQSPDFMEVDRLEKDKVYSIKGGFGSPHFKIIQVTNEFILIADARHNGSESIAILVPENPTTMESVVIKTWDRSNPLDHEAWATSAGRFVFFEDAEMASGKVKRLPVFKVSGLVTGSDKLIELK